MTPALAYRHEFVSRKKYLTEKKHRMFFFWYERLHVLTTGMHGIVHRCKHLLGPSSHWNYSTIISKTNYKRKPVSDVCDICNKCAITILMSFSEYNDHLLFLSFHEDTYPPPQRGWLGAVTNRRECLKIVLRLSGVSLRVSLKCHWGSYRWHIGLIFQNSETTILTQNGFPSGPMTPTTRGLIVYHSPDACRVSSVGFEANWRHKGTYRDPFVVIWGPNLVSKFQNLKPQFWHRMDSPRAPWLLRLVGW
jgi:hypothetical protein